MRNWAKAAIAVLLLVPPAAAQAQGINLTGSWTIQMQTLTIDPPHPEVKAQVVGCVFQGTANVIQTGSQLSGNIAVGLTSGGSICPSSMSASLSGNVTGNQITMGAVMGGGAFGEASFIGTVPPSTTSKAASAGTINGSFAVTSGPFVGTGGIWSAVQVSSVPALGTQGLAILALLVLGTAIWALSRRPLAMR